MSNYQQGDIVEFFNGENILEFGLIISVQVSDTISALVVSGFTPNHPQWISTDRVMNHWKNLKEYVSTCDILKAENERLKADLDAQKIVSKMAYHDIKRLCEELDMYKKMYFDLSGKKGGEDE